MADSLLSHSPGDDDHLPAPPSLAALFDISGREREFLSRDSALDLLEPLATPGCSYTSVSLSNCSFGLDAAKVAGPILSALKGQLRDVNLADVVAGRKEAEALSVMSVFSSALAGCRLRSLNLSDNALGEKGVRAFSDLLRSQADLEELYFVNNGISEEAAQAICELLPSARSLRILHFHNNMSGDRGAEALSVLVRNASLLKDFRFSSTRVGTNGGLALATALQAGSSLRRIDLRDNPFGARPGIALAKSLKQHVNLTEAYLSYLGLTDEGAEAVLKALTEGASGLKVLELAGNEVSDQISRALADCIISKTKLTKLNLAENELKDGGVVSVCDALMQSHVDLVELDVSFNEMGRIGAFAAAQAVAQKKNFKLLNIDGNHISDGGLEAVKEILKKGVCGKSVLGSLDENYEEDGEIDIDDEQENDDDRALEEELGKLTL